MSDLLKEARAYLQANLNDFVKKRYQGNYHYAVPFGWMNDPNGSVEAFSYYHVFYQDYPFGVNPKAIYWGHARTKDFIKWETCPIALAPDEDYDNWGCWSGGALQDGDNLYLMYTGFHDYLQQQCLAFSKDGYDFEKFAHNPILPSSSLPPFTDKHAFRDPFLFKRNKFFYSMMGARDTRGYGKIILYKSKDLFSWDFVGEVTSSAVMKDPGIFECPSYFQLADKDFLLASINFMPTKGEEFANFACPIYMEGSLDLESGHFNQEKGMKEIDRGLDFYAPQTMKTSDGRTIMVSWMQMWQRNYPNSLAGWVGSLTLPRELSYINDHLVQRPVREIENYKTLKEKTEAFYPNGGKAFMLPSSSVEISFKISKENKDDFSFSLISSKGEEVSLTYEKDRNRLTFDRSKSGAVISSTSPLEENSNLRRLTLEKDDELSFEVFLDVSSLEIFISGGKYTMTSLVFPSGEWKNIVISSHNAECEELQIYEIKVN
ncbi:MAG: sucrose-6-phosphate hydrolase [Bacilli bacterium]|nr:sucrose-6-phosphate hydrolase [Bacilli bacterium]